MGDIIKTSDEIIADLCIRYNNVQLAMAKIDSAIGTIEDVNNEEIYYMIKDLKMNVKDASSSLDTYLGDIIKNLRQAAIDLRKTDESFDDNVWGWSLTELANNLNSNVKVEAAPLINADETFFRNAGYKVEDGFAIATDGSKYSINGHYFQFADGRQYGTIRVPINYKDIGIKNYGTITVLAGQDENTPTESDDFNLNGSYDSIVITLDKTDKVYNLDLIPMATAFVSDKTNDSNNTIIGMSNGGGCALVVGSKKIYDKEIYDMVVCVNYAANRNSSQNLTELDSKKVVFIVTEKDANTYKAFDPFGNGKDTVAFKNSSIYKGFESLPNAYVISNCEEFEKNMNTGMYQFNQNDWSNLGFGEWKSHGEGYKAMDHAIEVISGIREIVKNRK